MSKRHGEKYEGNRSCDENYSAPDSHGGDSASCDILRPHQPHSDPDPTYELTHSIADAEYILSWDSIVSQCPGIGAYDRIGGFVHRGGSVQLAPEESPMSLGEDSPAAW